MRPTGAAIFKISQSD